MTFSVRRRGGALAVLVLLALAAAAVISGWLLLRERPAPGAILDLVALDAEHAVVVRELRGEPARSFVSLFHRQQGERWGALIPRISASQGARTAVAATGEAVTARVIASDGTPTVFAFAGQRGTKLGQVAPLGEGRVDPTGGAFELPGASNVFGGGQSFELYGSPAADGGAWATLVATDLVRGMFLWRAELGAAPVGPVWLRGAHVLVHQPGVLRVFERRSGTERTLAINEPACVAGDRIHVVEPDGALRTLSLPHAPSQDITETRAPGAVPPGTRLAGLCGWYNASTLVLAVHGPAGEPALVALGSYSAGGGSMQQRWRVELPGSWADTQVAAHVPDAVPLSGQALTRFVPVTVRADARPPSDDGRVAPSLLAMIDLDTGSVAWRSPQLPWLGNANLMTVDGRHYLASSDRAILALFDGSTGALAQAVRLIGNTETPDAAARYQSIWPKQIASGRIWLFGGERWMVLDAATLAVLPSAGNTTPLPPASAALATELDAPVALAQ